MSRKTPNQMPPLLLPAVIAAMPLSGQAAKPLPKSEEIIQSAKKALGGAAFFNPKPYTLNFSYTDDSNPDDGLKIFKTTDYYKPGKHRRDFKLTLVKNGQTYSLSVISDLKKPTHWMSIEGSAYNESNEAVAPVIPYIAESTFDRIFDPTPTIVEKDGKKYYQLTARYKEPQYENYRSFWLIDMKDYSVYQTKAVNVTNQYNNTRTYLNYKKVQGILVPGKIIKDLTGADGAKDVKEETISNFAFKNIPDSMFEVPKK
jgi:hypothetical protein